jgi:hypothetical protein
MPNPIGNVASLVSWKAKWKSGATQVIRIPVALADQILAYAHDLDQGQVRPVSSSNESLLHVIQMLEQVYDTPRNNFSKEKKVLLRTAIDKLKHCNK